MKRTTHSGRSRWGIMLSWQDGPARNGSGTVCLIKSAGLLSVALLLILSPVGEAQGFWPFSKAEAESVAQETVSAKVDEEEPAFDAHEFKNMISEMAEMLMENLHDADPEMGDLGDGIVLCAFVDLKKLYRTSSFGRYLSEQLMTELQRKKIRVIDMRQTDSILIREKRGEFGLSRDPGEITTRIAAATRLTGTYTVTEEHVMVNARILDNRSAEVLSSSTMIFPRKGISDFLLADRASAKPSEKVLVYKKDLEM